MIEIQDDNLPDMSTGLFALKFWAVWCGPCKLFQKTVDIVKQEFSDIKFYGVDVEANSALSQKYSVKSIPLFILIKDGVVVERIEGAVPVKPLRSLLNKYVKGQND